MLSIALVTITNCEIWVIETQIVPVARISLRMKQPEAAAQVSSR